MLRALLRRILWPVIFLPPGLILAIPWSRCLIIDGYDVTLGRYPRERKSRTSYGFSMLCDTTDLVQRRIYIFGVWEPAVTQTFISNVKAGDTVLDIGANVGYCTLLASTLVGPTGHVIAVEASPRAFARLQRNIAINNLQPSAVTVHQVAAAAEPGTVHIYGEATNQGQSSTTFEEGFIDEGVVTAVPIRDLVANPERVTFVKIDVEGDELACLRGMHSVLAGMPLGASAVIEITVGRLADRGDDGNEVLSLMATHGFEPKWVLPNAYAPMRYATKAGWDPQPWGGHLAGRMDVVFSKKAA